MLRTGLGLAVCLALSSFLPAAVADEPDKDGFRPLFNGKNLDGWVTPDDKELFSVENGEIVGRTKEGQLKKNEFLVTDKPYGDFVLKAKVKILNGNSGIQFRSDRAKDGVVAGPQADIADDYWGTLYEERRRGILQQDPNGAKLAKKGDWNEMVITAKGDHFTVELNGTKVTDFTDPKFEKSGIIALQIHAGPPMEVRFKDIEIKTLD